MQWHGPLSNPLANPLALTTGLSARLVAACGVVAVIWAVVAWAW